MRLIDADALDFKFDRRCFSEEDENYVRGVDEAIGVVKNAPTINPDDLVKHGEWLMKESGRGVCSRCHRLDVIDPLATHCRYCGAKMDGGKENE